MKFLKRIHFKAGEVIHYQRKPSADYQSLQRRLYELLKSGVRSEEKGKIEKELHKLFCAHFSIPTKPTNPKSIVRCGSDGGIMDHESCHHILGGIFEVFVTQPYGIRSETDLQKAISFHELLCIIEVNEWGYYYPRDAGCYLLVRFARADQRLKRKTEKKRVSLN